MKWVEQTNQRTRSGLVFSDGNNHRYESVLGTVLVHNKRLINMTPVRKNDGVLDGWEIASAGWHYRIGKPASRPTDGWVGFGGREGSKWLYSRVVRVGYLHYPTRAWQDVGGTPSYSRGDLSSSAQNILMGHPENQIQVTAGTTTEWRNIWTTPGSGEVYIQWVSEGKGLKENIVINDAARNWISANAPPSTPIGSTYFGFVIHLDVSDIPKFHKSGALQDLEGDFDDGDGTEYIHLGTDSDELLGFMPISFAYIKGTENRIKLRKRIWKDNDGNVYLLVGAKVSDFIGLPAGEIIFDPTLETPQDSTIGDTYLQSSTPTTNFGTSTILLISFGSASAVLKFDLSPVPAGANPTASTLSLWSLVGGGGSTVPVDVYKIKVGNANWTELGATWSTMDGTTIWAGTAGCGLLDTDYERGPLATANVPAAADQQVDFNIPGQALTSWLNGKNYGIILQQASADSSAFNSSDAVSVSVRPKLVVNYGVATFGRIQKMQTEDAPFNPPRIKTGPQERSKLKAAYDSKVKNRPDRMSYTGYKNTGLR